MEFQFLGADLLNKEKWGSIVSIMEANFETSSPKVIDSLFAKYYSYLVVSGALYCMSRLNEGIDFSLKNVILETGQEWEPILNLNTMDSIPFENSNRDTWREKVIYSIFAENLHPVFKMLVDESGIDRSTLWAHVSYGIHYLYEKWIKEAESLVTKERLQADFLFVTKAANPNLFGRNRVNPLNLQFTVIDHPILSGETLRLRKKCCLRYLLPEGVCCTTCPRLKEEERKEVLVAYHAVR